VKLTEKQEAFVREYLIDLNATKAAERAGYSKKTAYSIGQENLKKPEIQTALKEAIENRQKRTEVTQDMVVEQLAKIAFSDLKDFVSWGEDGITLRSSEEVDGTILQSVSEMMLPKGGAKTEIKLNDKMKALELLGKHLGMFKDNVNVNGNIGVTIVDDIEDDDDDED